MPLRPDGTYDYGTSDTSNPIFQQQQAAEYQRQADKSNSVGKGVLKAMQEMQKPTGYNMPKSSETGGNGGSGGGWRSEVVPGIILALFFWFAYCAFGSISHH